MPDLPAGEPETPGARAPEPRLMSSPNSATDLLGATDELRQAIGAAVLALPGVTGLEPTLINSLQRLSAAIPLGIITSSSTGRLDGPLTVRSAQDGVQVTRRDERIDVRLELITNPARPALDSAREARSAVRTCISRRGLQHGGIDITILGIGSR